MPTLTVLRKIPPMEDDMDKAMNFILTKFQEVASARFNPGHEALLTKFLVELMLLHKLEGRVRLEELRHDDYLESTELSQLLQVSRYRTQLRYHKQTLLFKELADLFQCQNIKILPILIKGISIYGLTEQTHHIRRSVDIDLMYSDPSILETLLTEIGFARVNDGKLSEHEFAMMARDDLVIDIHRCIPVLGCSDGMMNKAAKTEYPIIFESFTRMTRDEILYSELDQSACAVPNFSGMRVPNVHHQILILCTNLFRNYAYSQFHCSSGVILAELLDVRDLLRHPSFNRGSFESLIASPERRAAVDFVGGLINRILGDGILHELAYVTDQVYPKILLWNGLMELPTGVSNFIYYSCSDFTKRLCAQTFDLQGESAKMLFPNVEAFNSHGVRQVASVTLERRSDRLCILIELIDMPNALSCDVIEMIFEGKRCCFSFTGTNIEVEEQPEGCRFDFTTGEDRGYALHIKIPVDLFLTPFTSCAGLVICVTRWGDGPLSTLVPITIV